MNILFGSRALAIGALILMTVFTSTASQARVSMPHLFSDNMVLQRDAKIAVWGSAAAGESVTVSIGKQKVKALADGAGQWRAELAPMAAGGPHELTVTGGNTLSFKNVLIGDVWICAGQSNMQFGTNRVLNADKEIANANYPKLRLYNVDYAMTENGPAADTVGTWKECSPATVAEFSAVAYFFGRDLSKSLDVPVGLVCAAMGATAAESWTSLDGLKTMPDFEAAVANSQQRAARLNDGTFRNQMDAWYRANDAGSEADQGWAALNFDDAAWKTMLLPGYYNYKAEELAKHEGVVWFRKNLDLPAGWEGKTATLHLGAIDDGDTTWVNGVKVGATDGWNAPRDYPLPVGLLKTGRNILAVRVLNSGTAGFQAVGGMWQASELKPEPGEAAPAVMSLVGPWKYSAGVSLAVSAPLPVQPNGNPNLPAVLWNGMIAPLTQFSIKGVVWYQGELNDHRAFQYRTLLPALIKDWRRHWNQGDFPFIICQIATAYARDSQPVESEWGELREAQSIAARAVPNATLVATIDLGDGTDIHPRNKQDVGHRAALNALATVYGQRVENSGPVYTGMKIEGAAIRLSFTHAQGLELRKTDVPSFAICGDDKVWVWADARIEGNDIIVTSPAIADAVAVRYAWANNPTTPLYNAAGLPAFPFRTDDWPITTEHNK